MFKTKTLKVTVLYFSLFNDSNIVTAALNSLPKGINWYAKIIFLGALLMLVKREGPALPNRVYEFSLSYKPYNPFGIFVLTYQAYPSY